MAARAEYAVSVENAMARLKVIPDYDPGDGPKPCVHTFAVAGMLLGAHWSVEDARAAFEEFGVEEAGENMAAMGHGLVVIRPEPKGPLFFETLPDESERTNG